MDGHIVSRPRGAVQYRRLTPHGSRGNASRQNEPIQALQMQCFFLTVKRAMSLAIDAPDLDRSLYPQYFLH